MAVKPESTFVAGVNKLLPRSTHCEKMNNPYRSGTADVWYSGPSHDLWVEYKWLPSVPKKPISIVEGKAPALSHLQQKWLNERHAEQRNVAVVVGTPLGALILKDKSWMNPLSFDDLLTRQQVADWIIKETHHARNSCPSKSSTNNSTDV